MSCHWFKHQIQAVSPTSKKLYDSFLLVNRTAVAHSIMIFDTVVTLA